MKTVMQIHIEQLKSAVEILETLGEKNSVSVMQSAIDNATVHLDEEKAQIKSAYYAGYNECENGDANCFTDWREWASKYKFNAQQS